MKTYFTAISIGKWNVLLVEIRRTRSNEDLIIQKSVMGLPFVISYDKYTGNIKFVKISLKTKV